MKDVEQATNVEMSTLDVLCKEMSTLKETLS